MALNRLLKVSFKAMFGDYELYGIFQGPGNSQALSAPVEVIELSEEQLAKSPHQRIRRLAAYAGNDAKGFGILEDGSLVCGCWYWFGERYRSQRGFWPLESTDAKLVQITTAPGAEGRSLAKRLIAQSARSMANLGFERLFARIWIGHKASERAFEAAGWLRIATVVVLHPPWAKRPLRLQWKSRSSPRHQRRG